MSNVGEAGRAEEGPHVPIVPVEGGSRVLVVSTEEEPRDIHVVKEQLVQRESSPLITVVGQEHEPEIDPEEDPEEEFTDEEEEEELPRYTVDAEMYDELHDRNVELQDEVQELTERATVQQSTIEQNEREISNLHTRLGNVEWDLVHEKGQTEDKTEEIEKLKKELKETSGRLKMAEEGWVSESRRADRAEDDSRAKKAKLEETYSTLSHAMDEAQNRVLRYPIQFEGLPSYMLDRRTMSRIMNEERVKAKEHLGRQD